jgi:hypothetical protein
MRHFSMIFFFLSSLTPHFCELLIGFSFEFESENKDLSDSFENRKKASQNKSSYDYEIRK